jgi:dipeptidyl aminopeptidase/acylaminoacyl peptidase
MRPADIGELVDVGEPRVSPDGRGVAYVVTTIDATANRYLSRVWLVPADGSAAPVPLTPEGERYAHPRWSPDGNRLAVVALADDDEERAPEDPSSTLCVLSVGVGTPHPDPAITTVMPWSDEIGSVAWSPDGSTIACTARVREEDRYGRRRTKDQPPRRITHLYSRLDNVGWTVDRHSHLFVVAADGSSPPRQLTDGPYEDAGVTWSPDGTRLAFTSARHDDWDLTRAIDVYVVDVDGGDPVRVTATDLAYHAVEWAPGGDSIAVLVSDETSAPRNSQVGVVDAATGGLRVLTAELDRQCTPPTWDGDLHWFSVEDHGNVHLYRAGSGPVDAVITGDRCVSAYHAAAGTVAVCVTTPTALPELFIVSDGQLRQLSDHGGAFASSQALAAPHAFSVTSTGGVEVDAWIIPPVGAEPGRRYPTLLNIHGGPFTQYGNRFFDEFQLQAGAGFAVVYANPRGSSGSTEAWGRAIRWPECDVDPGSGWGGVDYDDVMAVIEEAVRQFDFVDGDRLGVIGGSYGGYMTSWIIGHTERFKAACSERAVNDVLHLEHDSDIAGSFVDYVGVTHIDDPEVYLRQSPIRYVQEMHTPLLILHSEHDLRCPISQADELFVALRLLRRDVEMVRFPGEGHELSRSGAPLHRIQRAEIILDFFTRHLT